MAILRWRSTRWHGSSPGALSRMSNCIEGGQRLRFWPHWRAGTKYRGERVSGESIVKVHACRCGSVLLSASVAAAATLVVAADQRDAPAVRIVATGRNDAGRDDNFRLAAVRHGANATD